MTRSKLPCILYVSSFPPRACGIATFSVDLTTAIDKELSPALKSRIMAINDNGTSLYNYPAKVRLQLYESDLEDYINRALEINRMQEVKLVNIQHEYGLFGGDWGDYLLAFLELLKKPTVVTMHTVLPNPSEKLLRVTLGIVERAEGIIVMTHHAARLLHSEYHVPKNKIYVIPHGVQHVPFPSKSNFKKKLGLAPYTVLSTFGMINRDKGIEYAIQALPKVVAQFPNVIYLVIGATHPNIVKQEGERYRNKLLALVEKLGLKDNVKFYNRYVTLQEKIDYLRATDIYLSPTLNPRQAVSGTISDALSCACPIIATANQYAVDTVSPERGILVKFRNSAEIEAGLLELLRDKHARKEMGRNAYFYSRHMTWQNVALNYFKTFNQFAKILPRQKDKLPPFNLRHLSAMTDAFGMIQFARHTKPDVYSGYNLDDNARVLLGMAAYYKLKPNEQILKTIEKYLRFVKYCQQRDGHFRNFLSYNKKFIDKSESEDTFGRAIWVLGYIASADHLPEHVQKQALKMVERAMKWAPELHSLRAMSFTILGLARLVRFRQHETALGLTKRLSDKLAKRYRAQREKIADKSWYWFEDCLTYSNSKLSEALFAAYEIIPNREYLEIATESLDFLTRITFEKDYFEPIGQDGWYFSGGKRSYFDQQPEDVAAAVEGYTTAYRVTKDERYRKLAHKTFAWFLGKNHLNQMVYDEATGGCYDGLGAHSLNFNQGAESTISYFLARLAVEKML